MKDPHLDESMATKQKSLNKESKSEKPEEHRGNGHIGKKPSKMFEFRINFNLKNIVLGLLVLFILFSVIGNLSNTNGLTPEQPLTTIINDIKDQKIQKIEIEDTKLTVTYKDGKKAISHKEPQESLV